MAVVAHASIIAKPKSFTFSIFTFPFVKFSGGKGMAIPEIPQSPNLGKLHWTHGTRSIPKFKEREGVERTLTIEICKIINGRCNKTPVQNV
jgi:hypothetical protein